MEKSKDGCWYGDTPGLADTKMRELAAQEIEAALRRNGMYRLVFIVTIEGGRVRPEDAATIRLVTQALKKPIPFAVVLNKLAADEVRALGEPENVKLVLESLLWSCTRKTELVHLIEYETSLSGKNEALCPAIISERLKEFLGSVSFFEIVEENVDNIERDSFDTVCKSIQAEMLKMRLGISPFTLSFLSTYCQSVIVGLANFFFFFFFFFCFVLVWFDSRFLMDRLGLFLLNKGESL